VLQFNYFEPFTMHVFQLVTTCLLEQNELIAPKQYIDIYFGIHQNDMIRTSKILTKYFSVN
jgi:hypothetical protein